MEPNTTSSSGTHALSLRVMRLTKPAIIPSWPLQAEKNDYCGEELLAFKNKDIASIQGMSNYPYGEVRQIHWLHV